MVYSVNVGHSSLLEWDTVTKDVVNILLVLRANISKACCSTYDGTLWQDPRLEQAEQDRSAILFRRENGQSGRALSEESLLTNHHARVAYWPLYSHPAGLLWAVWLMNHLAYASISVPSLEAAGWVRRAVIQCNVARNVTVLTCSAFALGDIYIVHRIVFGF